MRQAVEFHFAGFDFSIRLLLAGRPARVALRGSRPKRRPISAFLPQPAGKVGAMLFAIVRPRRTKTGLWAVRKEIPWDVRPCGILRARGKDVVAREPRRGSGKDGGRRGAIHRWPRPLKPGRPGPASDKRQPPRRCVHFDEPVFRWLDDVRRSGAARSSQSPEGADRRRIYTPRRCHRGRQAGRARPRRSR